jgi:hypothetical protein
MKKGTKIALASSGVIGVLAYSFHKLQSIGENKKTDTEDTLGYRRLECYYDIMTKWMELQMNGESVAAYLEKQGIHKVGIYGHGKVGILLYQDLVKDGMQIEYFLDCQAEQDFVSVDNTLVTAPKRLPLSVETDAIIVTTAYDFDEIEKNLKKEGYHNAILSLSQLLYQV